MTRPLAKTVDLSLILRGIFAVAVVFWHTLGSPNAEAIPRILNVPGRVSVWIFFGLSGYVIAFGFLSGRRQVSPAGLLEFYIHRAARILPLFWLLSILAMLIAMFVPPESALSVPDLIVSATAFQWYHGTYVIGVFWTLGIEIQFYIVAPILIVAVFQRERSFPYVLIALILVLMATSLGDQRTMIGNLQHFLVGMAVAKLFCSHPDASIFARPAVGLLAGLSGVLALFLASSIYPYSVFWLGGGALLTDVAIASLLVTHCALERAKVPANLPTVLLMAIGTIAYGIYAWHGLVLLLPWFQVRFLETLSLSVVLASFSYLLVERPIVRRAKRWLASQREPRLL